MMDHEYSFLLDINRLNISVIPNFILNDPTTRLHDGVQVYSLDDAARLFSDDIRKGVYTWVSVGGNCLCDMIYCIENLDNFTAKFIRVNRYKIMVRTGFGKKEYLWKSEHYFCIYKKYEWDLSKYRDLMYDFDFKDATRVNTLISQLFEIKDPVCFDYVSEHIKNNIGLNLTRDLCDYNALQTFLRAFVDRFYSNYNTTSKIIKDQVHSWFNILVEYTDICSNRELFETLLHTAWFLKNDNNNWNSICKVLVKCKIRHKVLNTTSGYTVEIFDWAGNPLLHFYSDNTRNYYRKGLGETYYLLYFHDILWRLCRTRPNETSDLFVASVA